MTDFAMPFGKYKGVPLTMVDDAYLQWLGALPDIRDPLRSAIAAELAVRGFTTRTKASRPDRDVFNEVIAAGVRSLAKRYHPDLVGGDATRMQQINAAADWLREYARKDTT